MNTSETNTFGALLKHYRTRKGLTQTALAYKIGKRHRGNIQAWEANTYLPSERETVLELAMALKLDHTEIDQLLLSAHYPQEYHTQGLTFSTTKLEKRLSLVDVYIHETNIIPIVDITLHNSGPQIALPTRVQIEILDVGEFRYCEDDRNDEIRIALKTSSVYNVVLSPEQKGQQTEIKIAHLLRDDEADRFQLDIAHNFTRFSPAYTWYYLKITVLYNQGEPKQALEISPLLLSIPPIEVDHLEDVWPSTNTSRAEDNKEILRKMALLPGYRSNSIEATIRQILGT